LSTTGISSQFHSTLSGSETPVIIQLIKYNCEASFHFISFELFNSSGILNVKSTFEKSISESVIAS
ncbi:MAG: hypothetical protein ACPHY8_02850, partial [Patescibacteria group bacterium]